MSPALGDSGFESYCRGVLELRSRVAEPRNLVLVRRVDSTQRLCRRLVREYLRDGEPVPEATVVAYEQTAGRGRQGRSWRSPAGSGAYVTLVRTLPRSALVARLPLLAGVALVRAVDAWTEGTCALKWPNDLMVDGLKIGGILIDAISRPEGGAVAFLGFGVNHGGSDGCPPVPEATSLIREAPAPPPLARLTVGLLTSLEVNWHRLEDGEWLVERYREVSAHRAGDPLSCRVGEGRREGLFRGFDSRGRLLLETAEGVEVLSSGEVLGAGAPGGLQAP